MKFPLSVSFGGNTEVFVEEEIDRWTADRIAERNAKAAALAAQHGVTVTTLAAVMIEVVRIRAILMPVFPSDAEGAHRGEARFDQNTP